MGSKISDKVRYRLVLRPFLAYSTEDAVSV
jgi:hypothetical protein